MLPYPLPAYILGNGPEPRRFQILVLGFQNEYVIYVDAKGRLLRTFGEYIVTDWEYRRGIGFMGRREHTRHGAAAQCRTAPGHPY